MQPRINYFCRAFKITIFLILILNLEKLNLSHFVDCWILYINYTYIVWHNYWSNNVPITLYIIPLYLYQYFSQSMLYRATLHCSRYEHNVGEEMLPGFWCTCMVSAWSNKQWKHNRWRGGRKRNWKKNKRSNGNRTDN